MELFVFGFLNYFYAQTKYYLYPMKQILLLLAIVAFFNKSLGQVQNPCPELDSVMAIIKDGPSELSDLYDKQVLFDCGNFDEVDRILLFGNFLSNFMAANLTKYDTLSYTIMLKELKEVQASPAYRESYEISKTRMILLNSIADTVLFDQYLQTFKDFFPNENERNYVRSYIGNHQNDTLTFIEVLENYTSEEVNQLEDEAPPPQQLNQITFLAFYDLKTTFENRTYYKRPILLYFSGYTNANSRKIEASWFNESRIHERLKQFTVYQVMCDQSLVMDPNDVKYFKKKYKKNFTTYGEKNAFIQMKEFKTTSLPYFVMYSENGKLLGTWTYENDPVKFENFLRLIEQ